MLRSSVGSVVLCLALLGSALADDPKKPPAEKSVSITKDKLIGEWKGAPGGPLSLRFTDKKVAVTVVVKETGVTKTTTLDWDYVIDAKGEWVNLHPLDGMDGASLGGGQLKPNGTLVILIVEVPPAIPKALKDVVLTRIKSSEPKK